MLKKRQILLTEWQEEYIQRSARRYDLSFSEIVRTLISEAMLSIHFSLEPQKKISITEKELTALKRKFLEPTLSTEERHRLLSRVYFEARRATEYIVGT